MIQIYQGVEGAIFLSNNKNLKMTAYTELKRRILRNELKPNEYLEEKQLCEMLGISRTPLREALSQLEREQLVVIVPTKGTFVADMSVKTAKDIFQMRHILEPIALRMAIPNLNPDLLLDYRRRFVSNLEKEDYAVLHQMDYEFHNDINKRCGNDYMIRVLSNLSDQFQRIRTQDFFTKDRTENGAREHIQLLDFMLRNETDAAVQLMEKHISSTESFFFQSLV